MQKCGLADRNVAGDVCRLVKLQRPPPEMRIFSPAARHGRAPARAGRAGRLDGAHHPGRAGAEDDGVEVGADGGPSSFHQQHVDGHGELLLA